MEVNILYQIGNERSKTLHSNSYEEEVHEGESVPPADVSDYSSIINCNIQDLHIFGYIIVSSTNWTAGNNKADITPFHA